MKPIIVYVYPGDVVPISSDYAWRFVASYREHPPGLDHETIVVLNKTKLSSGVKFIFGFLPNVRYLSHDDSGWDIGAFQKASSLNANADLMVFFGTSIYFKNNNWLRIMVNAYEEHGDGLYGCMGNRGDLPVGVWPHIRTTGFWLRPALFNQYPRKITIPQQRYAFEHGKQCLTSWITNQGLPALVVATNGVYEWKDWDLVPNGYRRGDQSALLCGDRITDIPMNPSQDETHRGILPLSVPSW